MTDPTLAAGRRPPSPGWTWCDRSCWRCLAGASRSADRRGHWVPTTMGGRYDAFCYVDESEALRPLPAAADGGERDTFPWAT